MFHSKGWTFIVAALALIACGASAQKIVPSPLLAIDQNRSTVVERIVNLWGDSLAASNAGITSSQLREILTGLRSDHLLAASLAGSVEGLRDVVSGALVHGDSVVSPGLMHTKSLGDATDDLVYTPVVPCRILDTRNGTVPPYNSVMVGGAAFPVAANLGSFATQGGSATNCNLPSSFQAIAVTFTVLNPNFDAFMAASSNSTFAFLTQSVVMDFSANKGLANTAIVPVDTTVKFYLGLPALVTTNVIADVQGYLRRPTNYGGPHVITGLDATDSGGFVNTARGDYSTVAGGYTNTASGTYSTVAGGFDNTASGDYSTVGGGSGNIASAIYSTVAGGFVNTASGDSSTVAGGTGNTAGGQYSFAAGRNTNAAHDGCFVWGDDSATGTLTCLSPNEVDMRAMGGFFFLTGGNSTSGYTGAELTSGSGAWAVHSDRASKDNLLPVDPATVLQRVLAMPITTWNWKAQGAGTRHMGPMAQDFYAAFQLGPDDKHIVTVDADGVALAAIQGLYRLVQDKDSHIAALERRLADVEALRGELAALKATLPISGNARVANRD